MRKKLLSPSASVTMSLALALGILVADLTNVHSLSAAHAQTAWGAVPVAEATIVRPVIVAQNVLIDGVPTSGTFVGSVTVVDSLLLGDPTALGGVNVNDLTVNLTGVNVNDLPVNLTGVNVNDLKIAGVNVNDLTASGVNVNDSKITGGVLEGTNIRVENGVITGTDLRVVGAAVSGSLESIVVTAGG